MKTNCNFDGVNLAKKVHSLSFRDERFDLKELYRKDCRKIFMFFRNCGPMEGRGER